MSLDLWSVRHRRNQQSDLRDTRRFALDVIIGFIPMSRARPHRAARLKSNAAVTFAFSGSSPRALNPRTFYRQGISIFTFSCIRVGGQLIQEGKERRGLADE